ncbi:hypothetical protein AMAG_10829 [Allomyces macrogynus ATCC 38327]|uniref:Uncharacterized protein n=1 Tax=Allomyces macrogynus (strain ATCC 38327) TaxID=578462 RepID=A0A0L0SRR5_ALLM3|nr:hypothetical protein AMAG_10829 [Allomyces macrogynus ATCC 38327]|eukprot:KNE65176.1 hypothetical protein AMAG_10829 [Allomyces macrogynus ATCC 38327]
MSSSKLLDAFANGSGSDAAAAARSILASGIQPQEWSKDTVERLLSAVNPPNWQERSLGSNVLFQVVSIVKLLTREPSLNEPLFAPQFITSLAQFVHLGRDAAPFEVDQAAEMEILKVFANLVLLRRQDTVQVLVDLDILPRIVDRAKSLPMAYEAAFLWYRILFLATADSTHVSIVVERGVDHYEPLLDALLSSNEPGAGPFTKASALAEVLKTMFNLASHTIQASPLFSDATLVQVARVLSDLPPTVPLPMTAPHSHAIHVLMNGDPSGTAWCTVPFVEALVARLLAPELQICFGAGDTASLATLVGHETPANDRLAPLFVLLTRLVDRGGVEVKGAVKRLLAPADLDRSTSNKSDAPPKSVAHALIRMLTSVEFPALREGAEELLFALFDGWYSWFVRFVALPLSSFSFSNTGFGPAAGFLVNRGLLSGDMLKAAAASAAGTAAASDVNPITGTKDQSPGPDDWDRMTDEEKEAEAERLFVAFERLNKLGVIKAVDPTTGQEIGPFAKD